LAFGDPGTVATTKAGTLNVSNEGSTWRSQFSAILTNFGRNIWRFSWKLMLRSILGRNSGIWVKIDKVYTICLLKLL
jgi:hypothetical protein